MGLVKFARSRRGGQAAPLHAEALVTAINSAGIRQAIGKQQRKDAEGDRAAAWEMLVGPAALKISAKCCSFSAVSAPIFASKYAFCSIFQNLQDYPAESFKFAHTKCKLCDIICNFFAEISRNLLFFQTDFLRKF